jgi:hypothetical protein
MASCFSFFVNQDLTFGRLVDHREEIQERRLPASGWTVDNDEVTLLCCEIDAAECVHILGAKFVDLVQPAYLEGGTSLFVTKPPVAPHACVLSRLPTIVP